LRECSTPLQTTPELLLVSSLLAITCV
jgi:hypothetical protein